MSTRQERQEEAQDGDDKVRWALQDENHHNRQWSADSVAARATDAENERAKTPNWKHV